MAKRLAAAAGMMAAIVIAACGGTSGERTPAPGSASPTVATTAAPPQTGIAELDAIIRATLMGDKDALVASLGYTKLGCVRPEQEGSPPGCVEGEADGTPVDSFLAMVCGGGYVRPDVAERIVRGSRTPARLYAAGRPAAKNYIDGAQYLLLFTYDQSTTPAGFWWNIRDGEIVGYVQTCSTLADAMRSIGPLIVTPGDGTPPS